MECSLKKEYLTATNFQKDSINLATKVLKTYKPDLVIALWRGGALPAIIFTEIFEYLNGVEVDSDILKISHYHNLQLRDNTNKKSISIPDLTNKKDILLVDDVFDTGNSIKEALDILRPITDANIKVATVYYKPENNKKNLQPDFYYKIINNWLVFPHEIAGLSKEDLVNKPDFDLNI